VRESIYIIEPLLHQIQGFITAGRGKCLADARTLFGTQADIEDVASRVRSAFTTKRRVLVDFTPFVSLGTESRWRKLEDLAQEAPFYAVVRKGAALERLKTLARIPTVICDEQHNISDVLAPKRKSVKALKASLIGKNFLDIHREWVHKELEERIPTALCDPPQGSTYHRLPDDTWANIWIDVKALLADPEEAFRAAYHMGHRLTRGYTESLDEHGFVVGNNTAYILAGFLQCIFDDKQLLMIDRLGPYPSLSRTRLIGLEKLGGRRFCMIEDVISLGREVDLIYLVLFLHNIKLERVMSMFDLEIGSPLLLGSTECVSLCKPRMKMKYRRFPKYKIVVGSRVSGNTDLK
jgi:hypothetical protein